MATSKNDVNITPSINDEWEIFVRDVYPDLERSSSQYKELRLTFYAGFSNCVVVLLNAAYTESFTTQEVVDYLLERQTEMKQFLRQITRDVSERN